MVMQRSRPPEAVPPLENGDHLSRDDFRRRYSDRADIKKAELIGGVVYVSPPVRFEDHAERTALMMVWVGNYALARPDIRFGDNATLRLSGEDEVQPDVMMFRTGGAIQFVDGYAAGVPELVIEVAARSASYDLHEKKDAYREAGVPEYIVWRTHDNALDWFTLVRGEYVPMPHGRAGVVESQVFPGLKLNVSRLLQGDFGSAIAG